MVDILVSAIQGLSLMAYLCGAGLVFLYGTDVALDHAAAKKVTAGDRPQHAAAWYRYLAYDS